MPSREPLMLVGSAIYNLERALAAYTEKTRVVYRQLALNALRKAERLMIEESQPWPPPEFFVVEGNQDLKD